MVKWVGFGMCFLGGGSVGLVVGYGNRYLFRFWGDFLKIFMLFILLCMFFYI